MKIFEKVFLVIFILLVIFQIKTTNIPQAYSFTPAETDQQIQRMNIYPPTLARLGYILESKKEIQIIRKLENNFFTVFDPMEYFPNRLPYIIAPFIFIGLYFFILERKQRKPLFYSFLFSVILLTFLGSHAKYGPVLLYPFFALFILICFQKLFKFRIL